MTSHKPWLIALIIITFLALLVTVILNYLSSGMFELDIYVSTTGDVSDSFYTPITPAGWTFSIWALIYLYQFVWMIYGLTTICRRNKKTGDYLYMSPAYSMPPTLYGIYIINLASNVTWIFVFDRSLIGWALFVVIIMAGTLYACIAISLVGTARNNDSLTQEGHSTEIGLIRGMVHNGLALYATWVSIATLLNFAMVLIYKWGVDMETASLVALSLLLVEIVAWVTVDFVVLDKHTRYLITPHIVIVWALSGSILGNWNQGTVLFNLTAAMLGLGAFALVTKIVVMIARTMMDKKNKVSHENLKS